MGVERFAARLGIPRSTWYYWRSAHLVSAYDLTCRA